MTSSILTNNGANSALMTLRGISYDLGVTQDRISSGLMVADASHNASVYATAQVMRSDIGSYDVIARTLSVSVSALGTALKSTQDIADQVQVIRDKVSEAWSSELAEVDKLQADVDQALSQINTIANG
ncbi:MAG: flagellin, partial [Pseudomonadota bacterium]